ncbi:MAG: hypothetical protein QOD77_2052 [Thermoplasmata archaeon]|jgi:hypothetical protein|nr:hypothetical protein [Thermoplasmata archaeon]
MRSALLLLGLLLLSGCSGDLATDAPSTTDGMTTDADGNVVPVEDAQEPPVETGEPVAIEETLDLTQPGSYDQSWVVKNGYRVFRVTVETQGAQGTPAHAVNGLGYRLTGGTPVQTVAQADPATVGLNAGSPGCVVCFDGGGQDPNAMAGSWAFHMEWSASVASAQVRIEVTY